MSATRITADDDGALSRPPHGPGHLVFGDLAVLRLIAGDELIKRPEPTVMFHFHRRLVVIQSCIYPTSVVSRLGAERRCSCRKPPYPPSLSGISTW